MKILQLSKFYYPYMGGIELVAEMISRAHTESGDEVEIISFGDSDKSYSGRYGETVFQHKMDFFKMSTPVCFNLIKNPSLIFKNFDYDKVYVHLHNPLMHFWLMLYGKRMQERGIKIIGIYHSDLINQKILGPLYELFFALTSSIFDKLIVSSPKLKNYSSALKFIDSDKVEVVPYPVKANNAYRERKKFNGKLLAIGRSVPYKGFEFLVDTINDTEFELNIIGDGPLFERLNALAKPNVNLLGRVTDEQKDQLIQESDVLVVSSTNKAEAYGMIIVEALQSGLPVIASNIKTGVTYLVQDQKTGLVFEPQDSRGLLRCLEALKDDNTFSNLSKKGHEFYLETLTFEKFKENLSKI